MPKDLLSAEAAAAIERYRKENQVVLMISSLTSGNISFRHKITDEVITKKLTELVYDHQVAKLEEQKTKQEEKKREDREAKWKPTGRTW